MFCTINLYIPAPNWFGSELSAQLLLSETPAPARGCLSMSARSDSAELAEGTAQCGECWNTGPGGRDARMLLLEEEPSAGNAAHPANMSISSHLMKM